MSHYENLQVPDDVNVGKASALGEFVKLAVVLVVFCVVLVVAVVYGMRFFAPYIPFRYEVSFAEGIAQKLDKDTPSASRQYLQNLADSLAAHMALSDGMSVTVHISSSKTPNAIATLGGHIVVTQGLLDLVDSENALAMVLAHEIGHVKHRDPIIGAGSAVVVSIVMGMIFGSTDSSIISDTSSLLAQLSFSRSQENAADQAALDALSLHYGHTHGAETFFKKILERYQDDDALSEFLASHPSTSKRLARIEITHAGNSNKSLTPLPDFIQRSADSSDEESE
ncbi:MAG: M48 family metallopeptidase [Burkholderiales bacterium]|nr:M48 family metallopeptidase [Burkholderiales bacterium]